MPKIIKYKLMIEKTRKIPTQVPFLNEDGNPILNRRGEPLMKQETKEETKQIFTNCSLLCPTVASYEANLLLAKREAYNGEYTVEGEFDPEPEYVPTTDDILNVLLGVNE